MYAQPGVAAINDTLYVIGKNIDPTKSSIGNGLQNEVDSVNALWRIRSLSTDASDVIEEVELLRDDILIGELPHSLAVFENSLVTISNEFDNAGNLAHTSLVWINQETGKELRRASVANSYQIDELFTHNSTLWGVGGDSIFRFYYKQPETLTLQAGSGIDISMGGRAFQLTGR